MRFRDRTEAGQLLARKLSRYANRQDVKVCALLRGGVPVAYEVAKALNLSLDVLFVRKLGLPDNPELTIGAIGTGGVRILQTELIRWLNISDATIDAIAAKESSELHRLEQSFGAKASGSSLAGKSVILVDDGIATALTARAAAMVTSRRRPARTVIATPIAPAWVINGLRSEIDEVIACFTPDHVASVGQWDDDFTPVSYESVRSLYESARARQNLPSIGQ